MIEGMSRAELDKVEASDFAVGPGPLRPSDAATLVVLDRVDGETRVLMGRRASRHAFMPGKFVFPGGRTDPTDGRVPIAAPLHPEVERRLLGLGRAATPARARAIAMSAIRETYEEAGLLLGRPAPYATAHSGWHGFVEHNVAPVLDRLRFIARAITPPGRVRRYDTRFLAAWRQDVAIALPAGPTLELEDLSWLPIREAMKIDLPNITLRILRDLDERLQVDPDLAPDTPTPFYRMLHQRVRRDLV